MADPTDAEAIAQDRDAAGVTVIPMVAPPSDIRRAIDKSYRRSPRSAGTWRRSWRPKR